MKNTTPNQDAGGLPELPEPVKFSGLTTIYYTADQMRAMYQKGRDDERAALRAAGSQEAALNAEYTRGRCDGFDAARSSPAAVAALVDAAMVERAIIAGCATRPSEYPPNWPNDYSEDERSHGRAFMRAALTAALHHLTQGAAR